MDRVLLRRLGIVVLFFVGAWLVLHYLMPILLPFILGLALALLAEPGVRFLQKRLRLPRGWASAIAMASGFVMLLCLLWLLGAAAYRELTVLAAGLPGFFERLMGSVTGLRDWALGMTARAPDGLRQGLSRWVGELFAGSSVLIEQAAAAALGFAGNLMGGLPGGALTLGTAVISSFMISAQLPSLKKRLMGRTARQWLAALNRAKKALGGWLRAQLKLSAVSFVIVLAGLLLLRVEHPVLWAFVTALVDAVPMLGTGTVLIPWCLWCLVQGDAARALGLAGLYVTAMLTRSALEPKLIGRHLGMNPLVTLVAMYAGYRIWGVGGMIFAPVLTVIAKQVVAPAD